MAKEEILSGIKNAISRGSSIDQAAQSFINAGYNPQEVQQAKEELSSGNYSTMPQEGPQPHQFDQPRSIQNTSQKNMHGQAPSAFSGNQQASQMSNNPNSQMSNNQNPQPSQANSQRLQSFQQPSQKKKKGKGLVIILSIVLILLLTVLGITLFFSDKILNLFS